MKSLILSALHHSRIQATAIFIIYLLSSSTGIIMVHNGNKTALVQRDKIVGDVSNDKITLNYQAGNGFIAGAYDFAGNLFLSAVPQTALGLAVLPPLVSVAFQGWVGGIVSVDGLHQSRFTNFKSAFYYFFVLLLQFIPFSLSIGAGIKCGLDAYRHNINISWMFWKYRIPKESLMNVVYVYIVSLPLFFVASCFEFLSSWNK